MVAAYEDMRQGGRSEEGHIPLVVGGRETKLMPEPNA